MTATQRLTINQRRFAKLAAQGLTLTQAHEQVYGKGNGTRKSKNEQASQAAANPKVKAAIEAYATEYEEQLTPIEDWRALRREMLQNIRWLAKQAKDERVRMAASVHLQHYADERDKQAQLRRDQPITLDGLMHEIRQLDAPAETIELEAVDETAEPPEPASAGQAEPAEPGEM